MRLRDFAMIGLVGFAAPACVVDSADEEETATAGEVDEAHSNAGAFYADDDGYRDPCLHGEWIVVGDRRIHLPIECASDDGARANPGDPVEKGTPEAVINPAE